MATGDSSGAARFYEVMDALEDYDSALAEVSDSLGEALLSLAEIRFLNPHSSITASGFRPTPALLKFDVASRGLAFDQSGEFVYKVDSAEVPEHEEQAEIERDVKRLLSRQDLDEAEKIASRFGNISNCREAVKTGRKFRSCLEKIVDLAARK